MSAQPMMTDAYREARIAELAEWLPTERDELRKRAMWSEMTGLINGRSPSQVRQMELDRGLA